MNKWTGFDKNDLLSREAQIKSIWIQASTVGSFSENMPSHIPNADDSTRITK